VAPDSVDRIDWAHSTVHLALTRDDVKASPAYDPNDSIDRQYEERLFGHYGRSPYWT